ncbi:hypothetical protein OHT57_12085 [Streptomyces sp. NBC_00285]|uniref:hypothetical protein n=1 Tax=Streptomyces sp. NBC_00285 TaxID=2975700 RepID=UPI002E29E45B|nr:hypothetical protein [Streptomyces sp. NBC_00285]
MRLGRVALGGVVLGLLGVVVRAEGRAVGRVLLGVGDARVSEAAGRGGAGAFAGRPVGVRTQPVPGSGEEARI